MLKKYSIFVVLFFTFEYSKALIGNTCINKRHLFLERPATSLTEDDIVHNDKDDFDHNSDDDDATSAFGTKEYWDELYTGKGDFPADEYQWYFGFDQYAKYVLEYIPKNADTLLPGIGNDPLLLDLLQKGYKKLTGIDYSKHSIERQKDILSSTFNIDHANINLQQMDARRMPVQWTDKFDAIIEKGVLDAIYLSGSGNLERAVNEFERVLKPGGILISVSGVVPTEKRKEVFQDWDWIRDGSEDMQAGCFVMKTKSVATISR